VMAYVRNLAREAIRNPFLIFVVTLLASAAIVYFAKSRAAELGTVWSEVLNTIGAAVLTSGTFGLWFDFFGKRRLISEVVRDAVGQTKSLSAGITDVELKVVDIDERNDFRSSSSLIIGVRRSAGLLDRYKDDIRTRLHAGKMLIVIRQRDASMFPSAPGYGATPDDFIRGLEVGEPGISRKVEIYETEELMSYNFVRSDRGIWIKLYFNARQAELPPAFFVSNETPLHGRFSSDITKLIQTGRKVYP
jgi:hypothetical protein